MHRSIHIRVWIASLVMVMADGWNLGGRAAQAAEDKAPAPTPLPVAAVKHNGPVDFEKEILPALRRSCLSCHNTRKAEAEVNLETPQAMLKGGVEGPVVVAGKSGESLLFKAAGHLKNPVMPPKNNDAKAKPLSPDELGLLKLWIDEGAKGEVKSAGGPVQWQSLPPGINPIYALAVTADGQYVAASRANQIFLYHLPARREVGRLTDPSLVKPGLYANPGVAHLDLVQSLAFSPDGELLASGGFREVKLWRRPHNVHAADFAGLEGGIRSLAVSGDGKFVAAGEEGGKIKLYSAADPKTPKTLAGHSGPVTALSFTPDGGKLLSGSTDKTIRQWNVAAANQEQSIDCGLEVLTVAVVQKGELLASGGGDPAIRIWKLPLTPEQKPADVKKLALHPQPVVALRAVGDTQLASAGAEGGAKLIDLATGQAVKSFEHGGPLASIAVRSDGKRLVTCGVNGLAKLFNVETGQPIGELKGDYRTEARLSQLARDAGLAQKHLTNGQTDLKAAQDRLKKEEDESKKVAEAKTKSDTDLAAKNEAAKKPLADKDEADKQLAAAKDALAKADEALKNAADPAKKDAQAAQQKAKQAFDQADQKVKQLTAPAQKAMDEKMAAQRANEAAVRSVARSAENIKTAQAAVPAAQTLVAQLEQTAKQKQADADAQKKTASGEAPKPLRAAAFSADGTTVAIGGDNQIVSTWSAETGGPVEIYSGQMAAIQCLAWSPQGAILSGSGAGSGGAGSPGSVVGWDGAPAWKLQGVIGSPDTPDKFIDRVTALDFSPDGKLLATGGGEPSRSGELKIWNVESGAQVLAVKDPHSDTIFGLEFSPTGDKIASCGADRFVKLFQTSDGKMLRSLEGHTHHVLAVSWQLDGRVLASAGADKVVKIWDALTGDQQRTVQNVFNKEVTALTFLRDPARIDRFVATSGDKSVRMFRAADGGQERAFDGQTEFGFCVRTTPDGATVVAGSLDGTVRAWRSDNGQLITAFESPKPAGSAAAPVGKQAAK